LQIANLLAGVLIVSSISGCANPSKPPEPLAALRGQAVTLEGIAEARKLGAALRGDGFEVWIDRLSEWPREWAGRRVRVTGVLEERNDLPVFVQKPGEPAASGIPVPEGTDLREASRRYVVRDANWSLIR